MLLNFEIGKFSASYKALESRLKNVGLLRPTPTLIRINIIHST